MGQRKQLEDTGVIHSLELACYHAVHDHPGGARAVAALFGWNPAVLQNKLNPTQVTHKVNAYELEEIVRLTKDPRILTAIGSAAEAVFIPVAAVDVPAGDLDVLERGNGMLTGATALINELVDALRDGDIDAREMGRIQQRAFELQQGLAGVVATAKQFEVKA